MKRIAIVCGVIVAVLNVAVTRITFALAHLAQQALATPLDTNPAGTVFFIRFWWWPLVFSVIPVVALASPWRTREASRLLACLVAVLVVEVLVLTYASAAFVVPLSHVPTLDMIKHGVLY